MPSVGNADHVAEERRRIGEPFRREIAAHLGFRDARRRRCDGKIFSIAASPTVSELLDCSAAEPIDLGLGVSFERSAAGFGRLETHDAVVAGKSLPAARQRNKIDGRRPAAQKRRSADRVRRPRRTRASASRFGSAGDGSSSQRIAERQQPAAVAAIGLDLDLGTAEFRALAPPISTRWATRVCFDRLIFQPEPAPLGDVLRQRLVLDRAAAGCVESAFARVSRTTIVTIFRQRLGRRRVPCRPSLARSPTRTSKSRKAAA